MKQKIIHILILIFISCSVQAQTEFNILNYGAKNDSTIVQTQAIQAAIDACTKAGGGRVIIPAGKYVSGTLFLKDYVDLHIVAGGVLLASRDYIDFPTIPPAKYRSQKDKSGWNALIYAEEANHISITGKGIIDGRGKGKRSQPNTAGGDRDGRPRNILFISCKNVTVTDVIIRNSATWNQHYLDCEDVLVDKIHVYNHANGNNDGIDIDGCRRFVISNSIIDADDDGIVLKSTGLASCEDVLITNCIVSSFANGIKCGTESTGGFKNIVISNSIIKPSRHRGERVIKSTPSGVTAISLEIVDGGIMDGVNINNILIEGTECPLYIRLANRGRKHHEEAPEPTLGQMRNINISNITAYGVGNFTSSITGIADAKIENVSLSNIRFTNRGGLKPGSFTDKKIFDGKRHDTISKLSFDTYLESFTDVIEDEKGYPQPTVWQNLPSYGLFVRHVENLTVNGASFKSAAPDPRPVIIAVNVDKISLDNIQTAKNQNLILVNKVKEYNRNPNLKYKQE